MRAFADLSIVNELDVFERSDEFAARADACVRPVFPTWPPRVTVGDRGLPTGPHHRLASRSRQRRPSGSYTRR